MGRSAHDRAGSFGTGDVACLALATAGAVAAVPVDADARGTLSAIGADLSIDEEAGAAEPNRPLRAASAAAAASTIPSTAAVTGCNTCTISAYGADRAADRAADLGRGATDAADAGEAIAAWLLAAGVTDRRARATISPAGFGRHRF